MADPHQASFECLGREYTVAGVEQRLTCPACRDMPFSDNTALLTISPDGSEEGRLDSGDDADAKDKDKAPPMSEPEDGSSTTAFPTFPGQEDDGEEVVSLLTPLSPLALPCSDLTSYKSYPEWWSLSCFLWVCWVLQRWLPSRVTLPLSWTQLNIWSASSANPGGHYRRTGDVPSHDWLLSHVTWAHHPTKAKSK